MIPLPDRTVDTDAALETLFLPFSSAMLSWPADGRVLFLRARAGAALPAEAKAWTLEQSFRPFADRLRRAGLEPVALAPENSFHLVLVLPPRQRDETRALLARALRCTAVGGTLVASLGNNEGARSVERDLAKLAGNVHSLSKNKCRVFWARNETAASNPALAAQWAALDQPRAIADGRFLSRPGLFAWDRIDAASALLASSLPSDLRGHGADLGAGFGYLAAEIIARCRAVTALDLYEAEARALALAQENLLRLPARDPPVRLQFHWHDVTTGLPGRYDFIVSNPPFHQGRADDPGLGRAFIAAAAAALRPGGSFWLVANRHLPYEAMLAQNFAKVLPIADHGGFKVIHAIRADA